MQLIHQAGDLVLLSSCCHNFSPPAVRTALIDRCACSKKHCVSFKACVTVCMKHCVAFQCGESGMLMARTSGEPQTSGRDAGLSVFNSSFERCSEGVTVQGRSSVSMQNVLCSRNGSWAFGCWGIGSRLMLTMCEVEGGGEHYQCEEGGKLRCITCRPSGPCMED